MSSTIGTAYIQIEPSAKGFNKSLSNAIGDDVGKAGSSAGSSFGGNFKKALIGTALAGVTAFGIKAGTKLVQGAVDAFGNKEQLVGGVQTLFGAASYTVIKNANNAFKTAGLSANAYMETVTSFSASLLQSVSGDTQKAAEAADMAIRDMSDNANKMGTSMESIQNAYMGFSKQNYTMLDNLKLGYGGTKKEMERLLEDATALTGVKYNIENLADVYNAIHAIQQNIGITGTTAAEAEGTIQGSAASIKAAWENVLAGMGDANANLGSLISDLVATASTFVKNLMPVISQALKGLVELISQLVPILAAQLPTLLPEIIEMAVQLVNGLAAELPTVLQYLIDALMASLPMLLDVLPGLITTVVNSLIQSLPILINGITQLTIMLVQAMPDILIGFIDALPSMIDQIVVGLLGCLPQLIDANVQLVLGLVDALPSILLALVNAIPGAFIAIIDAIDATIDMFEQAGKNLIVGLWNGMSSKVEWLKSKIKTLCSSALNAIQSFFQIGSPSKLMANEVGKWLPEGIGIGIENNADTAINPLNDVANGMNDSLQNSISGIGTTFDNGTDASSDSGLYELLSTYLPMIANNGGITLEGDAAAMFKVIRQQNNIYKKSTGNSAFA